MDYLPLINEYGAKLKEYQKPKARRLFNNLIKKGWSFEKIYWGIMLLKGRPIDKYAGLFYYDDFIEEINEQVEFAHHFIDVTYEKKVRELSSICGYCPYCIPNEYKEAFYTLDDKIWNSSNEYTKEELKDEVNYIYEKCVLIPMFTIPLEEFDYYPF